MIAASTQVPEAFGLLAIILTTSIAVALLLHRLRQSVLIGYFLCGLLLGAGGLDLLPDTGQVHVVSEVGVVLLMFSLGIEFSISELRHLVGIALRGGTTQICLATAGITAALCAFGIPFPAALFCGLAAAMSSTAIVLRIFQEGEHSGGSAGRLALGISVFQDIGAIALVLLIPAFAGSGRGFLPALLIATGKFAAFAAAGWLLSRFAVPRLLGYVHRTRSRELFTLMVLALCTSIAYLGTLFGVSLALGAFVAGLVVSETIYSHKILADILPFKDFFLALFFVGVGIQIDLPYCAQHWLPLLATAAAVLAWKTAAAIAGGLAAGFPARQAATAGIGLANVGEFSFVLAGGALAAHLIDADLHKAFLATGILTMAATPPLMKLAHPVGELLARIPALQHGPAQSVRKAQKRPDDLAGHAVICGYGMIGQTLNATLAKLGIPTLVIELNASTVHSLIQQGQPCLFADIAQPESLLLAKLPAARLLVITVPNFDAATAAVKTALDLNPSIFIVCRARYPRHVQTLRNLGVQVAVNEEAETSLEFVRTALARFDRTPDEIADTLHRLRFEFGAEPS